MNIQTVLSKFPLFNTERSADIFTEPNKFFNCHETFFEDILDFVRKILVITVDHEKMKPNPPYFKRRFNTN